MEEIRNKALEQVLQQAENQHWSYTIYREPVKVIMLNWESIHQQTEIST